MLPPPAYILAGGTSRRFGRDKARALLGGTPLILHAAAALEGVAGSVTVVARQEGQYADLGLGTIGDLCPGKGPLAGLQAALRHLGPEEERLLLLSCDHPGLRQSWLRTLAAAGEAAHRAAAFKGPRWIPLPGLYHRALLPLVEQHLEQDRLALWELLEAAGALALPLPAGWEEAGQVNTPEDLERISR